MSALEIVLIIVSILLIVVILLQQRSVGLGGAFGGDSAVFVTRRGAEKSLYRLTILLGLLLCGLVLWSSLANRTPAPSVTESPVESVTTEEAAPINQ